MPATTSRSKAIATATTLMLAWALTACATADPAGEGTPDPEPEVETTAEPVAETDASDEAAEDEQPGFDGGVSDIPLPDNHMVVDEQTADGFDTMLVHAPSEYPEYAEWYRSALPDAGWDIVSENPAPSTFGTVFEVTSDTTRAWVHLETFDAGTALFISVGGLDAETPADLDASGAQNAPEVELPDGLPEDVLLPVYSPSTMMAGGDHGSDMWVLEYVATATDVATVTAVIDQEIADKDWALIDQAPEGAGTKYDLEKSGYELILVVIPERVDQTATSLHYTLRTS